MKFFDTRAPGNRLLLPLLLCGCFSAFGQTLKNVRVHFDQSKQLMVIQYDVKDMNYKREIHVLPEIVADSQQLSVITPRELTGDYGWMNRGGKDRQIIWDPLREGITDLSKMRIGLNIDVREAKIPRFWCLTYQGSNSAPFGLKFSRLGHIGFFAGFRTGAPVPAHRYTISSSGIMRKYQESGVYEIGTKRRLASVAVTAGPTLQLSRNLYAYAGAGYGLEQLFWQYQAYNLDKVKIGDNWALMELIDYKGIAVDAGGVFRLGRVLFEAGMSTLAFEAFQITGGIGIALNKR